MGKCLVTRLNGVVSSNDNLKVLDAVVIKFNAVETQNENNSSVVIQSVSGKTLRVECIVGNFTDSTFAKNTGSVIESLTNSKLYVSNGAIIKISSKQNISKVSFADAITDEGNKVIDISDFKYCQNLTNLLVVGNNLTGKLEMAEKNKLTLLLINRSDFYATTQEIANVLSPNANTLNLTKAVNVKGDVSLLSNAIGLQYLYLTYTGISGTVESILEAMWKNGRKDGKLVITTGNSLFFDGKTHVDYGYTISVTFSSSEIVAVSNITRTFNGSAWVNS